MTIQIPFYKTPEASQIRKKEITDWAERQGSLLLKTQLAQGYDGWPTYLHERLALEFPHFHLCQDVEHAKIVKSPTIAEMAVALAVAKEYLKMGLATSFDEAFVSIKVREYENGFDEDDYGTSNVIDGLVCNNYYPGDKRVFSPKTIAMVFPRWFINMRPEDFDDTASHLDLANDQHSIFLMNAFKTFLTNAN